MTQQVSSLAQRATVVLPTGTNSAQRRPPELGLLEVVGTHGCYVVDSAGREYLDFHAAFGPAILGHNHPAVDRAVASVARELSLPGVGVTPIEVELAEKLVEYVPSIEQVMLTSSGTEATHHALRLARVVTGREKIVKFQGCYHGWHDSVAMNVISSREMLGKRDPLSAGIIQSVLEATLVLPFNDTATLEDVISRHRGEIAAVILEPIQHNIGAVLPDPEFLAGLRRICTDEGIVLIFDEVVTGIRHSLGGYQSIADVYPDLTTLGKALANGYPIGAFGGSADLMAYCNAPSQPSAFIAGTYSGHPVMAGAGLATISMLEREPVHEHLFRLGQLARERLQAMWDSLGVNAVVAGFGSVWTTYFLSDEPRNYDDLLEFDPSLVVRHRIEQMRYGVFEFPVNLKRSQVSYMHTEESVERLLEAAERSAPVILDELQRVTA